MASYKYSTVQYSITLWCVDAGSAGQNDICTVLVFPKARNVKALFVTVHYTVTNLSRAER